MLPEKNNLLITCGSKLKKIKCFDDLLCSPAIYRISTKFNGYEESLLFAVVFTNLCHLLTGEAGKIIEGKLNESASVKNGPFDMPLGYNENEATYILRIVGPGFGGNNSEPKTKSETD